MVLNRSRRRFLAGTGAVTTTALAGCMSGGTTSSEGEVALSEHPLGKNVASWPYHGPDPTNGPATLVVLDDPSCPTCARFHRSAITTLEAEYAAAGELSIVVRPYPVVYPWGEPASHALEATIDRDDAAFWELLEHYFANQGSFTTDTVFEQTETWLAENTDIDATAIVEDAREDVFADRIDATLQAAEAADAGRTTPATFAFVDGTLKTSFNGSQSTASITTALEL